MVFLMFVFVNILLFRHSQCHPREGGDPGCSKFMCTMKIQITILKFHGAIGRVNPSLYISHIVKAVAPKTVGMESKNYKMLFLSGRT